MDKKEIPELGSKELDYMLEVAYAAGFFAGMKNVEFFVRVSLTTEADSLHQVIKNEYLAFLDFMKKFEDTVTPEELLKNINIKGKPS